MVSFDIYNTNYSYGVVEVLDEQFNVKDAVLIDKVVPGNTSIKVAVWDNVGYLVRDLFQGDFLTYRQESGYSKLTRVEIKVPENCYLKITTDPQSSSIVSLVNYADILLSTLELAGDANDFTSKSYDFSEALTAKIVNDAIFAQLVKDRADFDEKLWKNVGKEALITKKSMGNFINTAINNLNEFDLLGVVTKTASDFGWGIGESVFKTMTGPIGLALDIMFAGGKVGNIFIQQNDLINSAGNGSIFIQNQGGGFRSCQQITVKCEKSFSDDTALSVFAATLDTKIMDELRAKNPEVYESFINGITHTYNISLVKNGTETQPDGKVKVYIQVPEDLVPLVKSKGSTLIKIYRVEENGELTDMKAKVEGDCFVFTTDHFSLYTIVGFDSGECTTSNQNNIIFCVLAIVGVAVAAVGVVMISKRKRK